MQTDQPACNRLRSSSKAHVVKYQSEGIGTLKFILAECDRLDAIRKNERHRFFAENGFSMGLSFEREGKRFTTFCGKEAERRLHLFAANVANGDGDLRGRVASATFYTALKKEFVERHFVHREPIGGKLLAAMVSAAK